MEERTGQILDAAQDLIERYGYDKTTMRDIAQAAGIGRGLLYLAFNNKEQIFEALLFREMSAYVRAWLTKIEEDPAGGSLGSIYRAVGYAISSRPFMAAIMRRDRHWLGSYLRKADTPFAAMRAEAFWRDTLGVLQAAGMVRRDIEPRIIAYILDLIGFGLVNANELHGPGQTEDAPPFNVVMDTLAQMLDAALTPPEPGDHQVAIAAIRELAVRAERYFGQVGEQSNRSALSVQADADQAQESTRR